MSKEAGNAEREEFIRKICDKQTTDALAMLKAINLKKYETVERQVLNHFERSRAPVDFDTYLGLIKDIDKEVNISFQRRNDSFGLDDIED